MYIYPYLLSFAAQDIEIFTLINGSIVKVARAQSSARQLMLLQSISIPDVAFISHKDDIYFMCHPADAKSTRSILRMSGSALAGKVRLPLRHPCMLNTDRRLCRPICPRARSHKQRRSASARCP